MTTRSRLKRLEQANRPRETKVRYDFTNDEWLEVFAQWNANGLFDDDPSFPDALSAYRNALEEAMNQPEARYSNVTNRLLTLFDIAERVAVRITDEGSLQHETQS